MLRNNKSGVHSTHQTPKFKNEPDQAYGLNVSSGQKNRADILNAVAGSNSALTVRKSNLLTGKDKFIAKSSLK